MHMLNKYRSEKGFSRYGTQKPRDVSNICQREPALPMSCLLWMASGKDCCGNSKQQDEGDCVDFLKKLLFLTQS